MATLAQIRASLRLGGRVLWLGHTSVRLCAALDSGMSVPRPWARSKRALPLPFLARNAVALYRTPAELAAPPGAPVAGFGGSTN